MVNYGDDLRSVGSDMESSPVEGSSSQGLGQNSTASPFDATGMPNDNPTLENNEINRTTNNSGNMEEEQEEESSHFESKKRKMTSKSIENKVFTISVDNASNNDKAIKNLRETLSKMKKLPCGGKLFHVRCCAHILNLIIENVHDSVKFINQNEARLMSFGEIVQQLQLPHRKLVLECKTRWNSTFHMLSTAMKFREVFPRFQEREPRYLSCPSIEDWIKVEKVCSILEVFNSATNIISGSEYPTSNLFLNEVHRIKVLLDKLFFDPSQDKFVYDMVEAMKENFDKYWKECNLLMSVAAVLDPRCKMTVAKFTFPRMYSGDELKANIKKVEDALSELYKEYVSEYYSSGEQSDETGVGSTSTNVTIQASSSGWSEFNEFVKKNESVQPQKSELDNYLEEGVYICDDNSKVASEATFSAGSRVIDTYRASLAPETVEVLLCGGYWCRSLHGLKRKNKKEKKSIEVQIQTDADRCRAQIADSNADPNKSDESGELDTKSSKIRRKQMKSNAEPTGTKTCC
ncbi:zinc finger BED domain-containing protein RICESLEEPER 2-like protein [Tanacetum coccineum]